MSSPQEIDSTDPMQLFNTWIKKAQQTEPNDPNAAALATATLDGTPSVRMVLAKNVNGHPFCFFTNVESRKGWELTANPRVALCFHWKTLRRQVRVEGSVTPLTDADVDTYFHSRSRASQIGAAVSEQSRPLSSREDLEARVSAFAEQHPGEIPRPAFWRGFHLHPAQIEFWIDGPGRLHDRFLFTRDADQWSRARLYP